MRANHYDELSHQIINACIEVHRELGPGLLESIYEACLLNELHDRGLQAMAQVQLPVIYKKRILSKHFYIDVLVEDKIVVELKTVELIMPVHEVQLVSYLKLSGKKLGLLINFNVALIRNGIRRRINGNLDE